MNNLQTTLSVPTELFPLRAQVDNANKTRLDNLPGDTAVYKSVNWVAGDNAYLKKRLETNCLAPEELRLKIGAQVMLIVNLDQSRGLVNGSLGIVEGFAADDYNMPEVRFIPMHGRNDTSTGLKVKVSTHQWTIEEHGKVVASREQVRLIYINTIFILSCCKRWCLQFLIFIGSFDFGMGNVDS